MRAALAHEPVLAADETPVSVLAPDTDPATGEVAPGSAQVMVIRTPAEKLVWLRALASRRAEGITALLAFSPASSSSTATPHTSSYRASSPGYSNAASTSSAAATPSPGSAPAACSPGPPT